MSAPIRPLDGDDRPSEPEATRTTPLRGQDIDQPRVDADTRFSAAEESTTDHTPVDQRSTPVVPDRATIVARQKERFGGIKVGSAFFGWLTATGMAVLLIALLTAAGVAFGVATDTDVTVDQAVQESQNGTGTAQTVGLVGGIILLVVLFVAYYCGGTSPAGWPGSTASNRASRCGCGVW